MNIRIYRTELGRFLSLALLLLSARAYATPVESHDQCAELLKTHDLVLAYQNQSAGELLAEAALRQISPMGFSQIAKITGLEKQAFKFEAAVHATIEEGEAEHGQLAIFPLKVWAFATENIEVDLDTDEGKRDFSPYALMKPVKVKRAGQLHGHDISLTQVYDVRIVDWRPLRITLFSQEKRKGAVFAMRLDQTSKREVKVMVNSAVTGERLAGNFKLSKAFGGMILDAVVSRNLLKIYTSEQKEIHYKIRPGLTEAGEYGLVFARIHSYDLADKDFNSMFGATLVFETR